MAQSVVSNWSGRLRLWHRALRYRYRLDPHEIRFVLEHLSPGDRAVDIGAHKGAYTFWMCRGVGPTGRVYAFEPQPALAAAMRRTMRKEIARGLLRVEESALSDRAATETLYVPDGADSPGAGLRRSDAPCRQYSIGCTTLDDYFPASAAGGEGAVRLIKCDTEGNELAVFKGGEGLLRRDRPVLIFECEARHRNGGSVEEVFAFLNELGYSGGFFDHEGRLCPIERFDVAVHQRAPGEAGYINNFVFAST